MYFSLEPEGHHHHLVSSAYPLHHQPIPATQEALHPGLPIYNKENQIMASSSSALPASGGAPSNAGAASRGSGGRRSNCEGPRGDGKPWTCSVCSKRFAMKRGLQVHVETIHENTKKYECPLCSRVFNQKGNLNNHIKVSHEKSKDYACELCDWKFSAVALLDKHMISVHKVEARFDCELCGQEFVSRKLLRKHKVNLHKDNSGSRAHEVKKRFFCAFCNSGFSFQTFLDKHIVSVHSGKPSDIVCKVCDKSFENRASLESHTATKHKQIHLQRQENEQKQKRDTPAPPPPSTPAQSQQRPQHILLTIPETAVHNQPQHHIIHQIGEAHLIPQHHQIQIQQQQQQQQQQQIYYQQYGAHPHIIQQPGYYEGQQHHLHHQPTPQNHHQQYIQQLQIQQLQYHAPSQSVVYQAPAQTLQIQALASSSASPPPAHQPVLTAVSSYTEPIKNLPQPAHEQTSRTSIQSGIIIQSPPPAPKESCDACGLTCKDKQDLIQHKALFHTFKCEICEEKFPNFDALKEHKVKHLIPCPVCEVRFKESPDLSRHFEESHKPGKELCEVCWARFFESKEELKAHLSSDHGPEFKVKYEERVAELENEVQEHKKFVNVVDELVVQLQQYKDKSNNRKRKSKDFEECGRPQNGNSNSIPSSNANKER